MERAAKLRKLNDFRRKLPHISASGLSAVLTAIKADGLPEGDLSRDAIREARDQENLQATPHGPILDSLDVIGLDGEIKQIPIANPFALMWTIVKRNTKMAPFLLKRLQKHPPTLEMPWHLVIYSDEVTPGEVLSPHNLRKFQAVYYSFLELGPAALSREESWMTAMVEYSVKVNELPGGLSQVFGCLIKAFFPSGDPVSHLRLPFDTESIRLFFKLGVVLQDGGARKVVWSAKIDGSSKTCLLCKNLFTQESNIPDEDDGRLLVCNVLKHNRLVKSTSDEIRRNARYLATLEGTARLEPVSQALGLKHRRHSLLLDRSLDDLVSPCDVYTHDWMHCICANGVANLIIYLLFEAHIAKGMTQIYATCKEFVQRWSLPVKYHGQHLHEIFSEERKEKHRKASHIKCQASDILSLLGVLALFTQTVLLFLPDACRDECLAFLALVHVVELIKVSARTHVAPERLLEAVEDFLGKFATAFGIENMLPKHHWMLHFHEQLQRNKLMLNCFCLERKHRAPKRYATEYKNVRRDTNKQPGKQLLMEVTSHHLAQLLNPEAFEFDVGLVHGRKPSRRLRENLLRTFELDDDALISVSTEARFSDTGTCNRSDFVIFKEDGRIKLGKVQLHCEIENVPISMLETYKLTRNVPRMGHSVWEPCGGEGMYMLTEELVDAVPYSMRPDGTVMILNPIDYR